MTAAETGPWLARLKRIIEHPATKIAVPLIIAAIAFIVLHRLANEVRWRDVKADLAAVSRGALLQALGATTLSFLGIAAYDVLSTRALVPRKVPVHVAALASAGGYAISGLLGVSYLTGTAVRYRVYSGFGLDLAMIANIIAISWSGLLSGMTLLLGLLLALHPVGLGAIVMIPPAFETALGLVLLGVLAGYLGLLAIGSGRIKVGGFALQLPGLALGGALTAAGLFDLGGAAMTLLVLMPKDLAANLPYYFTIYFGAVIVSVLSHSPGGLGVFEATIIAGLGAGGRPDVLASLLLYRMIYTFLPFATAVAGLAAAMTMAQRKRLSAGARTVWRIFVPLVPSAAAGIAMLAGVILLVSGNLPAEHSRLGLLRELLPLPFMEASHLAGSIIGLLLIVVARGLYRKLYRAWAAAIALLAVGLVASLLKGLDWRESLSMLATLAMLAAFRPAFYRAEGGSLFRLDVPWLVSITVLLAAIFWVGLFAYSHVPYRNDLWWEFAWRADAPRFLRASLAVAIALGVIAFNSLLSRRPFPLPLQPIPDAVRRLVLESEDTEAWIALTGDKAFLLSDDERAFIAYADTGRSLIARGDPIGDNEAGRKLIWRLRELADRQGRRCAFYGVSAAYLPTYLDLGLSILKIGEVARVDLRHFTLAGGGKKNMRHAQNRAAKEGFAFSVVARREIAPIIAELRQVSDAWLEHKQGEEKGFTLGAFTESYIMNFDIAVTRAPSGEIAAFANLLKGAKLHELSIDLMRHRPDAPSFVMDALFAELMLWGKAQGFHWFSLGAAPFSGMETRQLAPVWNRFGSFVFAHGQHFYNFEGLRSFKEKFDPEWSPDYLACPGGLAAPRILYEVNMLISGGIGSLVR